MVTSPTGSDVIIIGLTVFVLAFAILSGTGIHLRNVRGVRERASARTVRLVISLVVALLVVVWVMRKN